MPNPGRVVYPVLPVLRQAMQGGKTPQRLSAADDPTKGAMTSIILPNASSLCGACREVCPVRIDIPRMLLKLRGTREPMFRRLRHGRYSEPSIGTHS